MQADNDSINTFNRLNNQFKVAHPSIVELLMSLRDKDHLVSLTFYKNNFLTKIQEKKLENNRKIIPILRNLNESNLLDSLKRICGIYNFHDSLLK